MATRTAIARTSRTSFSPTNSALREISRHQQRTFAATVQRKSSYPEVHTPESLKKIWNILPDTRAIKQKADKMSTKDMPSHEMAYFKGLATSKRAFGDFRRVLHTGLYSQLVVMEVPVNGEIGMFFFFLSCPTLPSCLY